MLAPGVSVDLEKVEAIMSWDWQGTTRDLLRISLD